MATAAGGSAQPWPALLIISLSAMLTATQKSVVSLKPPWISIFTGEKVTLSCLGNSSLHKNSTKWIHNGTISKATSSNLVIMSATIQDSGKYICQNQGLYKSKPVYLKVMQDWLLLQTTADVVLENESFDIRCHGWKNKNVHSVTYYQNGIAFKYCYKCSDISRKATLNGSGTYHCTGCVSRLNCTSEEFRITVIKAYRSKYFWLQLFFPLLVVTLFAVDTGLLISTQEEFKSVLTIQMMGKRKKP